jgi:hypothetical protein
MKLVRKVVTKDAVNPVSGISEQRTYVNVILVTDDGLQIPIKSSFANDAKLLKQLAREEIK